jgi:hypothetical protein
MSYEPDQRYSTDRAQRNEIDTAFEAQPPSDRGQFWNVSRSVRGAAVGAGLAGGGWFAALDPYDLKQSVNSFTGTDWMFPLACLLGGAVLGFIGASLRRRSKGED